MPDITNQIGRNYPITSYGCSQSVSGSTTQLAALNAEKSELAGIFAEFLAVLDPLLEAAVSGIGSSWEAVATYNVGSTIEEDAEIEPRTGTCTGRSAETALVKFGNYGVENGSEWDVLTTVTYEVSANEPATGTFEVLELISYAPAYTIFDTDGPEPKCMLLEYDRPVVGWGLLATPSIHNKSGIIFVEGYPLTFNFRFGAPMEIGCTEDQMFVDNGWTFIPFYLESGGLGYPLLRVIRPAGALWDGNADILAAMADVNFVGEHIYAYPSTGGVYGVQRKIDSLEVGQEIMGNTKTKMKSIDSFYRLGDNNSGLTFANWVSLGVLGTDITYIDEWNVALLGNLESQTPSGTELFYDIDETGSGPISAYAHGCNNVIESAYHLPSMATYCEIVLTPDVLTTINFAGVTASNEFGELLISNDIVSLGVSGGSTYTDILYVNQLTVWLGSVSSSSLPTSGSATPLIATHASGLVNYFNVFKTTDGVDPYAGMTKIRVGEGIPLSQTIMDVYIKGV